MTVFVSNMMFSSVYFSASSFSSKLSHVGHTILKHSSLPCSTSHWPRFGQGASQHGSKQPYAKRQVLNDCSVMVSRVRIGGMFVFNVCLKIFSPLKRARVAKRNILKGESSQFSSLQSEQSNNQASVIARQS